MGAGAAGEWMGRAGRGERVSTCSTRFLYSAGFFPFSFACPHESYRGRKRGRRKGCVRRGRRAGRRAGLCSPHRGGAMMGGRGVARIRQINVRVGGAREGGGRGV